MSRTQARSILVIGAGGFGREVHDVIVAINAADDGTNWDFLGFLDDGDPDPQILRRRGATCLGRTSRLPDFSGASFVVGVAAPEARRRLSRRAELAGLVPVVLRHPSATVGVDTRIGEGTVICGQVSVTTNVTLGRHVHLNPHAMVGHDVVAGDYVTLNPGAAVSGAVQLGDGATLGANSTVIQGLTVGRGAMVGAGAAVIRDVAPGATVAGVPAREINRY